jgi:diguanylate cyclase (GGDEF)-like protein
MLDIDHFKTINDRHGHLAGDQVLREVSRILLDEMRQVDLVGRFGGEEFMMLLDETRAETALVVAERIRHAIAATPIPWEGVLIRVTASFGIVEVLNGSESIEELVERVDKAMYQAKQRGRNRTVLAHQAEEARALEDSRSA